MSRTCSLAVTVVVSVVLVAQAECREGQCGTDSSRHSGGGPHDSTARAFRCGASTADGHTPILIPPVQSSAGA